MKLTYWFSARLDDSDVYSIRVKTRKECLDTRNDICEQPKAKASEHVRSSWGAEFGPVVKVTVEYDSGFDLMQRCMSEDRLCEEWEYTRED